MKLISERYRQLNQQLHAEHAGYGSSAWNWVGPLLKVCEDSRWGAGAWQVLDYGCGKGTLAEWMPRSFHVHCYDPGNPKFAVRPPRGFQVTACLDVMEHVEERSTVAVLEDIRDFTERAAFFVISTQPASKDLPDGRNAHINLRSQKEWLHLLRSTFVDVHHFRELGKNAVVAACTVPRKPVHVLGG